VTSTWRGHSSLKRRYSGLPMSPPVMRQGIMLSRSGYAKPLPLVTAQCRAVMFPSRDHTRALASKGAVCGAHGNSLGSGVQRLILAPKLPACLGTDRSIRQPSVAELACDFHWGHDLFSLSRRAQLANAALPPGDKLKHVPRWSRRIYAPVGRTDLRLGLGDPATRKCQR
jgi:hypothetical protein